MRGGGSEGRSLVRGFIARASVSLFSRRTPSISPMRPLRTFGEQRAFATPLPAGSSAARPIGVLRRSTASPMASKPARISTMIGSFTFTPAPTVERAGSRRPVAEFQRDAPMQGVREHNPEIQTQRLATSSAKKVPKLLPAMRRITSPTRKPYVQRDRSSAPGSHSSVASAAHECICPNRQNLLL